jgi:ATP-dependent RNA helicase SUPV3L1/SUV3
MPRDLDVSFLAVDEIQIAADLERGTSSPTASCRRGRDETLLRCRHHAPDHRGGCCPALRSSLRPRLSQLEFSGDRADAAAAAHRDRRVLGRRGLCDRGADKT